MPPSPQASLHECIRNLISVSFPSSRRWVEDVALSYGLASVVAFGGVTSACTGATRGGFLEADGELPGCFSVRYGETDQPVLSASMWVVTGMTGAPAAVFFDVDGVQIEQSIAKPRASGAFFLDHLGAVAGETQGIALRLVTGIDPGWIGLS